MTARHLLTNTALKNRWALRSCVATFLVAIAALSQYAFSQENAGSSTTKQTNQQSRRQRDKFAEWDRNGDGYVSRKEFQARGNRSGENPVRTRDPKFDLVDTDRDGRISRAEDVAYRNRGREPRSGQSREDGGTKGTSSGDRARRLGLPKETRVETDVIYASVGDRKLPLDLYLPAGSGKRLPLVIWIHGGGWKGGSKEGVTGASRLVGRGFALASVEYRLSGEATFPAAIEDCKAAVSFLRLNARKYNLDPNRFGVWGRSAGGHLVALLGTTNDVDDFDTHAVCKKAPPLVQAVCNWFGPTDFLRMNDFAGSIDHDSPDSPESRFIGGPIQQNREKVGRANPIRYVSAAAPPMLIMHGEADQKVPYNQSELLHAALQKAGVQSTLYKVKNGDHGFRGSVDSSEALLEMVAEFFDKQLK